MAVCVMGRILDTDVEPMAVVVACRVHCHYAPCPKNGEPASTTPIDSVDGDGRERALHAWDLNTKRQRPLLLHRGTWTDERSHQFGGACWCGPERFEAVS
jgi:hypothetical protein